MATQRQPKASTSSGKRQKDSSKPSEEDDPILSSIAAKTRVPKSLEFPTVNEDELAKPDPSDSKVTSRYLQSRLVRQHVKKQHAALARKDAEILLPDVPGGIEAEGELERTYKVGQEEIVKAVGVETAKSRRDIKLDGGDYRLRWSRNGA